MSSKKISKKRTSKKRSSNKSTAGRRVLAPGSNLTVSQKHFLEALVKTGGNIERTSEMAHISKWSHYEWKSKSEPYREAYAKAIEEAQEVRVKVLENAVQEAWEKGWDEEVAEEEREAQLQKDGTMKMVATKQKLRKTKKRFLNALFYEYNRIAGNPALRHEHSGPDGGPIDTHISLAQFRSLVQSSESDVE